MAVVAFTPFVRGLAQGHALYFRDLAGQFFPIRAFVARGLAQGQLWYWNPLVYEGTPVGMPPLAYPIDALQAFAPSAWALSLLLALHVPLAALSFLILARGLGLAPLSAAAGALVYGLGGFMLSTINVYVYVQAMAWAPVTVLALSRAAQDRRCAWLAGALLALCLSTLAAEIVVQTAVLGTALALGRRDSWRLPALGRLAAAGALAAGLSAPLFVFVRGILGESERAAGFAPAVILAHSVHPLTLVQVVVANWHGDTHDIVNAWWGVRFFTHGFPYILSLYLGGVVIVLAAAGLGHRGFPRRVLVGAALLALWICLGQWAGWGALGPWLPGAFRFPVKAFFTVHIVVALLAAAGLERLRDAPPRTWTWLVVALAAAGLGLVAAPWLPRAAEAATTAFASGFFPSDWPPSLRLAALGRVADDARLGGTVMLAAAAAAGAAAAGRLDRDRARIFITAVMAADLLRAGSGLNPMVSPSFYELSPETSAVASRLREAEARVFTCDVESSPTYHAVRRLRPAAHEMFGFLVSAETFTPFWNVNAQVASAYNIDRTMMVPMSRTLPSDVAGCAGAPPNVRILRAAGVTHVVSLDPVKHPDLHPAWVVRPARIAPAVIHIYSLANALPREVVATTVQRAARRYQAEMSSLAPGFLERGGSVVEGPPGVEVAGARGEIGQARHRPGRIEMEVEADRRTVVVAREGFASGWTARVDGAVAPVWRANGRHLAVPIPAGKSRVTLEYRPPHMRAAVAFAGVSAAALVILWRRRLKTPAA